MTAILRRVASNTFVHLFFAFVGMGSWAFFANRELPMPQPLVSALVQGMLSSLTMLFLKSVIDFFAGQFDGQKTYWLPAAIACLTSAAVFFVIHLLGGTHHVVKTVIVPLLFLTGYATFYNYSLFRQRSDAV